MKLPGNKRRPEVPQEMITAGLADPELEGAVLRAKPVSIVVGGKVVGWHTPRKDKNGWRVGAIYINPAHRGKGYGKQTVKKFLADKIAAPVPIRVGNISSEQCFRAA